MFGRFALLFVAGSACRGCGAVEQLCGAGAAGCDDQEDVGLLQWRPRAKVQSALLVIDMQNDFINGTLTVPGGASIIPKINELSALKWGTVVFSMDYHPQNHISFAINSPTGTPPFQKVELSYNKQNQVCGKEYLKLYGGSASECESAGDIAVTFNQKLWPPHCIQGTTGQQLDARVFVPAAAGIAKKGITTVADSYGAFENNIEMYREAAGDANARQLKIQSENSLQYWLQKNQVKELYVAGLALDYCVKFTSLQGVQNGYKTYVVTDATKPVAADTGKEALAELKVKGVGFVTTAEVKKLFG